ncbi:KAR9-domain-containing protein [Pyrenochaeta sp. DS3sAY3a]|nr:KAR9-domain-containing protein [Pyrenochaeta sp. DS3sAY3a]
MGQDEGGRQDETQQAGRSDLAPSSQVRRLKCSMSTPAASSPALHSARARDSSSSTSTSTSASSASPAVHDRLPAKTRDPPFPPPATTSTSPKAVRRTPPGIESATQLARNVSPGLLARMKFLNQSSDNSKKQDVDIGRIDEGKIRRLDAFHRDRSINVERRGTAWSGIGPRPPSPGDSPLVPQLTGDSVPALTMEPDLYSDHSSVVSTSDKVLPSESEPEHDPDPEPPAATEPQDVRDRQKYRLPDIGKTKSLSQTLASTAIPSPVPVTLPLPLPVSLPRTNPPAESPASTEPEQLTRPPTPPPKDTPPLPPPSPTPAANDAPPQSQEEVSVLDDDHIDIEAYFQRRHFPRANSIYTLSKASFTNQLHQLTSMQLPPTTIASEITALPSSTLAGRALYKAANDIRLWMAKAKEVLSGLDAEDDVEWAAAAGREGLAEVDAAIGKFEGLVTVYITAIEDLQSRPDIAALPAKDLTTVVGQMEVIMADWAQIKHTLKDIKNQVEHAMEWEELWNNVLGEIGAEIESLSRLVFEMEERRHRVISDSVAEAPEKFEIADLETIVEDTPRQALKPVNNRFSMPPNIGALSPISPIPQIEQESSRLLELFAKLQPLRASLDFLPMRLASFRARASEMFPSACDELTRRKEQLEELEKKLEADAEALREELGEDKWVHSFRQAGSKALAMYDSCMKSIQRLQQAIDDNDEEKIGSRIAYYKDKRDHYPPSMKRVLELIDIEMKHRSTVNGEILRIQQDVRTKVTDLEAVIKDTNAILDDFTASRKLRDSVSTVLSARTEASLSTSALDTPNSSPASSVVMSRKNSDHGNITPVGKKSRQSSVASSKPSIPSNRRYSSLPMSSAGSNKGFTVSRLELDRAASGTPTRTRNLSYSKYQPEKIERPVVKPKWNSSTNMRDTVVGHNFKPMSLTTSSPYGKAKDSPDRSLRTVSSQSSIPVRSPLSRSALSPPPSTRPASTTPAQKVLRRPVASPMQSPATPARGKTALRSTPVSSPQLCNGTPVSGRRVMIAEEEADNTAIEESPIARRTTRPGSSMTSRRSSMLPAAKQRTASSSSGTSFTAGGTPARSASRIASTEEGRVSRAGDGRASRVSGRQSSMGEKPAWR